MSLIQLANRIENWPVDRLIPYERNARTHSADQVTKIAASITEFGFTNPILVDSADGIIAGHGRLMAAKTLGLTEVPVIVLDHLTDAQRRAYILADNRLALDAGWDEDMLAQELADLHGEGYDLSLTGFSDDELADLLDDENLEPAEHQSDQDDVPEPQPEPVSRIGDVWVLGRHRVMCGDSTNAIDVSTLMAGRLANLLHADPPYGMGKEADGVANDNLRGKQLDGFQMDWWGAFRAHLQPNASAYIWGNAPDLWRLWYVAGLGDSEVIEFRNEIVWDKKNIAGMASPDLTQYPEATERCLFFQLGKQFLGNVNAGDFHESWEPLRSYMEGEAKAAGMTPTDLKMICSVGMYGHWFTRSQFTLIPESHYRALAAHYPGRFLRPWSDLKEEWSRVRGDKTSEFQIGRSYFDNAHDVMRDVWEFPRVIGEERHGHATPKPVDMMIRAIKSSTRPGELVVEPFGGSGSTLIGAEVCGRVCFAMEMQPRYVDVIVRRWEKMTGKVAILERDGRSFAEAMADRLAANDNQEAGDAVA